MVRGLRAIGTKPTNQMADFLQAPKVRQTIQTVNGIRTIHNIQESVRKGEANLGGLLMVYTQAPQPLTRL